MVLKVFSNLMFAGGLLNFDFPVIEIPVEQTVAESPAL